MAAKSRTWLLQPQRLPYTERTVVKMVARRMNQTGVNEIEDEDEDGTDRKHLSQEPLERSSLRSLLNSSTRCRMETPTKSRRKRATRLATRDERRDEAHDRRDCTRGYDFPVLPSYLLDHVLVIYSSTRPPHRISTA